MELHPAAERLTNGGTGTQDLVPRDNDQAKDGDEEHADPLAPGAEAALLWDSHAQPHTIGQPTPVSQ